MSVKFLTVVLCAKKDSGAVITQGPISAIIEKVKPEMTDTLGSVVLFQILRIEVSSFAKPTYKVQIGIGIFSQCVAQDMLVHKDARPNIFNEAYPWLHWKYLIKRLVAPELRPAPRNHQKCWE